MLKNRQYRTDFRKENKKQADGDGPEIFESASQEPLAKNFPAHHRRNSPKPRKDYLLWGWNLNREASYMVSDVGILDRPEWRHFAKYPDHSAVIPEKAKTLLSHHTFE